MQVYQKSWEICVYAALKHSNCEIVSFEPSTSNLRTLSRNISINNLEDRIKIFTSPLSNKTDRFLKMKEGQFVEGGALNSFGEDYNFEGKKFDSSMNYQLIGKSINSILENKILDIPNYIKIDVDGIEHLILNGAAEVLLSGECKTILVEINDDFKEQANRVSENLNELGFSLREKRHGEMFDHGKYSTIYNQIWIK